jgi:hypothetical protein
MKVKEIDADLLFRQDYLGYYSYNLTIILRFSKWNTQLKKL